MTAHVKVLAAPELQEAVNGVLHVGKLQEKAHGVVNAYANQAAGDVVALHVKTSTGNSFETEITVTDLQAGKPLVLAVPKDVFEKKLVPKATAELHYTVARAGQNLGSSDMLRVKLER